MTVDTNASGVGVVRSSDPNWDGGRWRGRAIALQLGTPVRGIRLVAIANRTRQHAERAFREAGFSQWGHADSSREAEAVMSSGLPVLGEDPPVLTRCDSIDSIVEVTGTVDVAAQVVLDALNL